jgi:hypothetical protein
MARIQWKSLGIYTPYRHEELYEGIGAKVIRSDELPDDKRQVSMLFRGATVVLCTLGMLSNPKLLDCGLFGLLPVKSLVIDEASQIDVFEFMVIPVLALRAIIDTLNQHLFHQFSKELTKVCFFGDPKQREPKSRTIVYLLAHAMLVPPYGAGEAGLETIFDIKHLKKKAYFLDTQCNLTPFFIYASLIFSADRLPIRLGEFISKNIYEGKLRSSHSIMDYSCISFIDVGKGKENKKGNSYLVSGRAR